MSSSCTTTANVSTGSIAGKESASPVLSEKQAPCKGQMTVSPSISPSDKRAHSCVQTSLMAKYLPSTLNTAMGGSSSHFTPPEASSDILQTRRKAMAKSNRKNRTNSRNQGLRIQKTENRRQKGIAKIEKCRQSEL